MNRKRFLAALAGVTAAASGCKTPGLIRPDVAAIGDPSRWTVLNGIPRVVRDGSRNALHLKTGGDQVVGESRVALALASGVQFKTGTIEVELRGKNKPQSSFLGVAFHVQDLKTHEAIYFRPFNFKNPDPVIARRSVQYIAWPDHTWRSLREKHPGKFENAVTPLPDPDDWFHARIVVGEKSVRVHVNRSEQPCLMVERLVDRPSGGVGLWVDIDDGHFASFSVQPAA